MDRLFNINGWQTIKIMLVLNKVCTKTQNGYFFLNFTFHRYVV